MTNSNFFKSLQSLISKFVWDDKPPHLKHNILRRPKSEGGMGNQDVKLYHIASHLTRVLIWCRHKPSKQCVSMEQAHTDVLLIAFLWYSKLPHSPDSTPQWYQLESLAKLPLPPIQSAHPFHQWCRSHTTQNSPRTSKAVVSFFEGTWKMESTTFCSRRGMVWN